jgi:hypothetical protein
MPEQPKICPFSFGLAIPKGGTMNIPGTRPVHQISVGIPCAKDNCVMYSSAGQACVILRACEAILLSYLKKELKP